ncbi:hypothetical protein [Chryseobacterium shigense]|uniref:Uncharacterized protein n=1 Tax=Chryseobacterium shigense TaxID=297244 RepID=A0A841MYK1_9FLAO|nr:hypothetical protein [Chryseobacterium shigense]MBB6369167.1 hypothetical protein [Chryseobacterium shigense]
MNKSTKKGIIICVLVIVFIALGFIFNPFYWLMQPTKKTEQPETSFQEKQYFQKLEKKYNAKIKRLYYNKTKKEEDTLYSDYASFPFEYSISIDIPKNVTIQNDSILNIAINIKDKILNKNKNLKKIRIYKNYETYLYDYNATNDTIILQK